MRRVVATLALVVAVAGTGHAADAQDTGSTQWAGSSLEVVQQGAVVTATAFFDRQPNRTIRISVGVSGGPAGCPAPAGWSTDESSTPKSTTADIAFPCNGTYAITARASTTRDTQLFPHDEATRSRTVAIEEPAPTVTGVTAEADSEGRLVTVTWDDMRGAAPDLSGYVVQRKLDGDDAFSDIAPDVTPDQHEYVDEALPADGGEVSYRVLSKRPAADGQTMMLSAASSEAATPYKAPVGPAAPGSADGAAGGTAGGAAGGSAGGPSGAGPGVLVPRLGSSSSSFLTPLLKPTVSVASRPTTTTTLDTGFDEDLPYDDAEPGTADAVLPDDEMASVFEDTTARRGMAIPVATALVLAVWAFHLRHLARAARPEA